MLVHLISNGYVIHVSPSHHRTLAWGILLRGLTRAPRSVELVHVRTCTGVVGSPPRSTLHQCSVALNA